MTDTALSADAVAVTATVLDPPAPMPGNGRFGLLVVNVCYGWLALVVALAAFASVLPIPSYAIAVGAPRESPSLSSIGLWLGTDAIGRSTLSRLVHGAQVSLIVAAAAGLAGFLIGTALGLMAGYFRRKTDTATSILADVLLAFPPLVLLMALAAIYTSSITTLVFGLGVTAVPAFLRLARAHTISWATRDFVRASRGMGAGHVRIMFREILPNLLPALAAYLPIVMASLIVFEGSLDFLGLGIPPPKPSWGGMINDGSAYLSTSPLLVFIPALVIFFTVFSLNEIGDHLRARFDRTIGR